MNYFTADPRDVFSGSGQGCNACCCGQASARPGETNKWSINYAAWAFNLGGRGLTDRVEFSIIQQPQNADPRAPVAVNHFFNTPFNTALEDTVATGASDPLEGDLSYALYDLFPAQRGEVVFNSDGSFVYTPVLGFTGYDTFYYVITNEAKSVVKQVIVGVNAQTQNGDPTVNIPAIPFDKPLSIVQKTLRVDRGAFVTSFAVKASPIATLGDIFRVNVKQPAIDCDCQEYVHISCYDVTIVNC
jgi:hypothetical protein